MIKKALEYIISLSEAKIMEIDGETYCDKSLNRVSYNPRADEIEMSTLTSLVEYIKNNIDVMRKPMIVHVITPTEVLLYTSLDFDRKREYLVRVKANIPRFVFDTYINHEEFCVNLQSKFVKDEETERDLVLKFAGTISKGSLTEYGDDGITQKATIKNGITSKADAKVPNPVCLKPFRTFQEVEQPNSNFIFRMRENKCDEIECALFEADGGAWRNKAMDNIKKYLKEQLDGIKGFTVIS